MSIQYKSTAMNSGDPSPASAMVNPGSFNRGINNQISMKTSSANMSSAVRESRVPVAKKSAQTSSYLNRLRATN